MRWFAEEGKSKFPGLDADMAEELLAALDAATSLRDVSPVRSVGRHKLRETERVLGDDRQWPLAHLLSF